jgi:phosphohistidine phosphatase
MKTLLILRHGKSDWSDSALADFDRPLAKRGRSDAPLMGDVLHLFEVVPDTILSSPALRARQTVELVAGACGYRKSVRWEDSFYGGSGEVTLQALRRLPESVAQPLVVGHNPTLEETVSLLLRRPGEGWDEHFAIRIPTAGLVCLDLDIVEWAELEEGDGVLRWFLIPKLVNVME